ncbi:MAG: hypothetical protein JRH20_02095 [Deltaproteobacteria bacterium]|nr:hypothetical protein [Deltaproteobacteria bacterium]
MRIALGMAGLLWVVASCASNQPPEFVSPPDTHTGFVANRMDLTLLATDPDGDSLTFNMRDDGDLGSQARLSSLSDRLIFSWTPAAADVGEHAIDFIVSDGSDSMTHTVRITIKSATDPNTAPIFRRPLGEGAVLDLATSDTIAVDILVEDADSVSVKITQEPAIEGASFRQVGQLAAIFQWTPSDVQTKTTQHLLRLWADDGDNPPVSKDYTIVIRRALPTGCVGEAPVVQHTPPPDVESYDDLVVEAKVTDDRGLKEAPVLYLSTSDPGAPADISKMQPYPMSPKPEDRYEVTIPNPVVGAAAGTQTTVYYLIVAEDDDDREGDCDHRVQAPESGSYRVRVTAPEVVSSCSSLVDCPLGSICDTRICQADTCTPQDLDKDNFYHESGGCPAAHFCPVVGPSVGPSHCVLSCAEDSECGSGRACKIFDEKYGCAATGVKGVGEGCGDFTECAGRLMCMPWSGGYCSLSDCESSGDYGGACPGGSICYPNPDDRFIFTEKHYICAKECTNDAGCRQGEGYRCQDVYDDYGFAKRVCLPIAN